jgi:23S rRNA G2069 N7-methylase RlmK/C1962 C5-methylase RlmI
MLLCMKTNPNRVNRTLRENGSGWATTLSPYEGATPRSFSSGRSTSYTKKQPVSKVVLVSDLPQIPGIGITSGIVLERGKARLFQDGNPLIYGNACQQLVGDKAPEAGDEIFVMDHMGNCIGRGLFNPHSQYRIRVLARKEEKAVFHLPFVALMEYRFAQAIAVRKALLGLQSSGSGSTSTTDTTTTDVYRLVNGEGDRLSGLIVDVIGRTVVVQSSALWCEKRRSDVEAALASALCQLGDSSGGLVDDGADCKSKSAPTILWRRAESRLRQDGIEEGLLDGATAATSDAIDDSSPHPPPVVVSENGIKYHVDPHDGQKTGFYADQRHNRAMIGALSSRKSVLDTFCYTGGFALSALRGGATAVTCVDSSAPALEALEANMELNGVDRSKVKVVKADAIAHMQALLEDGGAGQFDIVICDPPKLAPKRTALAKAMGKYTKINKLGMQLVKSGGLLLTCTCSAAMTQQPDAFRRMLLAAAKAAEVDVTVLSTTGAAPCHVIHPAYPEGGYLTAVLGSISRPNTEPASAC